MLNATHEFIIRQTEALTELIETKDAYITRLQDEVSQRSSYAQTVSSEQNNFRNTVKELVLELIQEGSLAHEDAQKFADACDFELTKTITITGTVDYEIEVTVPFDTDPDDVIASLEYSIDAFDYSIDDFSFDSRNVDWSDNIS